MYVDIVCSRFTCVCTVLGYICKPVSGYMCSDGDRLIGMVMGCE